MWTTKDKVLQFIEHRSTSQTVQNHPSTHVHLIPVG